MTNIFLQASEGFPFWGACPAYLWWTLGAFLLGSLLTWLLTRGSDTNCDDIIRDRDRYHSAATKWEKDYQSLKYQLDEAHKTEADLRASLQRCEADKQGLKYQVEKAAAAGLAAGAAGAAVVTDNDDDDDDYDDTETYAVVSRSAGTGSPYDGLFERDDFQIIEGIGPKVNAVLIDAGYRSWDDLAVAEVDDLRTVLANAGSRFSLSDPTSWPHQAKLAAAGDWDELIRYQKFTDGGRETTGDFETDSKFEKLVAKRMGFSSANPNDLKVVEGIGPKIEKLLKSDGINTWAELAAADLSRLEGILTAAGDRYKLAKPGSWPEQARLAANGEWQALSDLQADLKGGV